LKVLDLSLPYDPPLNAGSAQRYSWSEVHTAKDHGVAGCHISLFNHLGTHVDAPLHLVPGGRSVDQYDPQTWIGPAVVVHLPRGENEEVSAPDLRDAVEIVSGDMVLICTGWDRRRFDPEYASHHPYLSVDAAEYLVERGVRVVGMDVQSVDLGHSLRPEGFRYTSLRALLEAGVPVLHSLANLDQLAGMRVTVSVAPINFAGLDGSPVRAMALIHE
jgi:arylformamidase